MTEIVDPQVSTPGGRAADPSELSQHLAALLPRIKMAGREWAVIVAVLLSTDPITAREVGRRARIAYPHSKAIIRTLIAWGRLQRHPGPKCGARRGSLARARRRLSLLDRAKRAGGQDGSGWVLYRLVKDSGRKSAGNGSPKALSDPDAGG